MADLPALSAKTPTTANIVRHMERTHIPVIPSGMEWVFLAVVIAVLFFGVKKLLEPARSFGRTKIESQRELDGLKRSGS